MFLSIWRFNLFILNLRSIKSLAVVSNFKSNSARMAVLSSFTSSSLLNFGPTGVAAGWSYLYVEPSFIAVPKLSAVAAAVSFSPLKEILLTVLFGLGEIFFLVGFFEVGEKGTREDVSPIGVAFIPVMPMSVIVPPAALLNFPKAVVFC